MEELGILLSERVKQIKKEYNSTCTNAIKEKVLAFLGDSYPIYKQDDNTIKFYCTNSVDLTQKLINHLYDQFKPSEQSKGKKVKVFGKRTGSNIIKIRFGDLDFYIEFFNIGNQEIFTKLKEKSQITVRLLYNYTILASPQNELAYYNDSEIVSFVKYHLTFIDSLYDSFVIPQFKNKKLVLPAKYNLKDYILVGSLAIEKLFGIIPDFAPDRLELLYIGKDQIQLKNRHHDEFYGSYGVDDHGVRIYYNTLVQYHFIKGWRVAVYPLILKYLLLGCLFETDNFDIVKWMIVNRKENKLFEIFSDEYGGTKMGIYEEYYKQIWGNKPRNYQKTIEIPE